MRKKTRLPRSVVIRQDHQCRIGARGLRVSHMLASDTRIVRAAAGDDGHAPLRLIDADREDPIMLLNRHCGAFAGRAARHEGGASFGDLPLEIVEDVEFEGKVVQYTSELDGASA